MANNEEFLNKTGLGYVIDRNKATFASKTEFNGLKDRVDEIVAEGGEPNVIDTVKVNGVALTPVNKAVDVIVPTKTSDITNDSNFQNATQVQEAIDAQIGSTYEPKGSIAFADLPAASAAEVGNVYDITDSFTTTADFKEGAGKTYPAGTNVVIIEDSGTYKYDALSGFVDLSNYYNTSNLAAITTAEIDELFA